MALIFVFGSNLAGRHGLGSAKEALKWGAIYGQGIGRQGDAYAIPTKGYNLEVLPLDQINDHVQAFLEYARNHHKDDFVVVAIGCGLAGYKPLQIAPMFRRHTGNVALPKEFQAVLKKLS